LSNGISLDTCLQSIDPAGVAGAAGVAVAASQSAQQAAAAQLAASIGLGTVVDAYA
jgi:hypothetical protein